MIIEPSQQEIMLIKAINLSFSGKFHKPARVTEYKVNDPEDYDVEGESVEEFFKDYSWEDIDLKYASGYLLGYLNTDAFLYYLPAFLIKVLEDHKPDNDFTDRFFRTLCNLEYWGKNKSTLMSSLSNEHKSIIYLTCKEVSERALCYDTEFQSISKQYKQSVNKLL